MLSSQGQKIRKERLKLSNNQCELAIYGRQNCENYRLECHHKDDESYIKDLNGTISINDVIIVCCHCHDFLTDCRRSVRFSKQRLSCNIIKQEESEVRNVLDQTKISASIGLPFNDAKCSERRSDEQIR